jgi:hypothetical protein
MPETFAGPRLQPNAAPPAGKEQAGFSDPAVAALHNALESNAANGATRFVDRRGDTLRFHELAGSTAAEAMAARLVVANTVRLLTGHDRAAEQGLEPMQRASERLGLLSLRAILPESAHRPTHGPAQPSIHGRAAFSPRTARRSVTEAPFSIFKPPEASYSGRRGRSSSDFADLWRDFSSSQQPVGGRVSPPIPEAIFSHREAPQKAAPPRPYTPTFNTNFKDANFSPAATAEAQRVLAEVAKEKQVQPGDVVGRMNIMREARRRAHPDTGGDLEAAKVLGKLYDQESKTPAARAAKAAAREQARARVAANATEASIGETQSGNPAAPSNESVQQAPPAAAESPAAPANS